MCEREGGTEGTEGRMERILLLRWKVCIYNFKITQNLILKKGLQAFPYCVWDVASVEDTGLP